MCHVPMNQRSDTFYQRSTSVWLPPCTSTLTRCSVSAYNRPKEIIMFRVDFRFLCCNHILWYLVAKLYIGKRREVRQCSTWNCSKAKLCIRKFTRITQFASIKRWKIQFKKCKLFYCHRMYKPSSAQSV